MQGRIRLFILAVLLAVIGASAWLIWKWTRPAVTASTATRPVAAADPRLTYSTPYRNVRPEVKYLGDEVCARCHPTETSSYRQHPMARSMSLVNKAAPIERYDRAAHNPFQKFGFDFLIEQKGERVFHKVVRRDAAGKEALALAQEARYVLGSGAHGRAYLSSVDNYIFQTPINWFSQGQRWDLAPNVPADLNNHYFRVVDPLCIYCHGNQADPIPDSVNHYRAPLPENLAIGCERCHGPGELHVQRRTRGDEVEDPDDSIVNPARLAPVVRDSVCEQCHLHGEMRVARRGRELYDYRPGLPLHLFWSVFVKPPEQTRDHQAVSHVEQMHASKCFRASNGKLGCISCHDPHLFPKPEEKLAVYRAACLECHAQAACTVPVSKRKAENGDNCALCHMPRLETTDVAHTATSDHRIPRRPGEFQVAGSPQRRYSEVKPLVNFFESVLDPDDKQPNRDFAVGLIDIAEPMQAVPERTRLARAALPALAAALEEAADDLPALHARGSALWLLGSPNDAMACYEAVLRAAPGREATLTRAARLATNLGDRDKARSYWQQAIAVNPQSCAYHTKLGWVYADSKDWRKALQECRKALEINPLSIETRMLSIAYYLENGPKEEARSEFEKLMLLDPPDAKDLQKRFGEIMKMDYGGKGGAGKR
jgi:Flp pilus assembly protein TadD